jgi:hypothetical protein
MQGSHRFFVDYRYDSCGLFAEGVIPKTAIGVPAAKERFVRKTAIHAKCSQRLQSIRHSDILTTSRYIDVNSKKLSEAVERFQHLALHITA